MEKIFSLYIYWDPSRAIFSWNIPFLDRPLLWYGFFFALGFFLAYLLYQNLLKDFLSPYRIPKKEILKLAERTSLYVVIGTIIGARLGDVLFYQSPQDYVHNPLDILKFWEGGLSSHGGIIGILISLWVFSLHLKKEYPMLNWVVLLDLLAIPALFAGGFIRLGNFFNQEILGTPTSLPWGVIFGHPLDGGMIVPRHPVQLYEALFYFSFGAILWLLRKKVPKISKAGKTVGLFFVGTFTFRFFIEFLKVKQSALLSSEASLDMGQILSIPLIALGILFFLRGHLRSAKRH